MATATCYGTTIARCDTHWAYWDRWEDECEAANQDEKKA